MKLLHPDNIKYLKIWQGKDDFVGKLDVEACEKLVKAISERTKGNKGQSQKEGLLKAKSWLAEAKARQAGFQKRKREEEERVARQQEGIDK